jgi:murein L,D-transpeptidase YcbB/YkuD
MILIFRKVFKIQLLFLIAAIISCQEKNLAVTEPSKSASDTISERIDPFTGMFSAKLDPTDTTVLQEFIEQAFSWQESNNSLTIAGVSIANKEELAEAYAAINYKPFWITRALSDSVFAALSEIEMDGLLPQDYFIPEINLLAEELLKDPEKDLQKWAELDILITSALLKYCDHLLHGKVDPFTLDSFWNFPRRKSEVPIADLLEICLEERSLQKLFVHTRPQNILYQNSRLKLTEYRKLAVRGGWKPLSLNSDEVKLEPGDTSDFFPKLRIRLFSEGFLDSSDVDSSMIYDDKLQQAVANFQVMHGLYPDKVIGKSTIGLLNIPVTDKVESILVNLERMRWAIGNLKNDFILVNAAQYKLWLFYQDTVAWQTEVIIGTPKNSTPFFTANLKSIIFNPTWTVPYSIASKEILPKLKANPGYLHQNNMILLNKQGQVVNPSKVHFNSYSSRNFPYVIRQKPGKSNSLGLVKFEFPNPYSIYIHDTPSKNLFTRDERALSHGCIRVNKPIELAKLLLQDPVSWNDSTIADLLDSGVTKSVAYTKEMPVYLLYFTHYTNANGQAYFFKDIYQADKKIMQALVKPSVISK